MLPLRLKCEPVFSIEKDIEQIREATRNKERKHIDRNVSLFPTSRAYLLTKELKPVAIFDHLGPGFSSLLRIGLTIWPQHIANPESSFDIGVMNVLRKSVHSRGFKSPYIMAVFIADSLCFHFPVSSDLMVVICDRLKDLDIVERDLWEFFFDVD